MAENLYGDDLDRAEGGYGAEIARQRMDALDRAALAYALDLGGGAAVDLGAGEGIQALRFAALGLHTVAIDVRPRARTLFGEAALESILPLRYLELDARLLREEHLPGRVDVAYSQRFIHHLPFDEARRVLALLRARMPEGARLFLSASGLGSELAEGYAAATAPLARRYAPLSATVQSKHHLEGPVCLYAPEELGALARAAGFAAVRVERSAFGNVKGIFAVGSGATELG